MKLQHCPAWLDDIGKAYWRKISKAIGTRLNDSNVESFAVLCEIYSLLRQTTDPKQKKNYIDAYIRLATQFGLTPKSEKTLPHEEEGPDFFV